MVPSKLSDGDSLGLTQNNRVKSTAEAIMNCFHKLVMEKDFKKLTVSEICEEAGVSRKTFYKYFKDKNDIVEQILIKDILNPMEQLRELYTNMELPSGMIFNWQYQQFYNDRKFYQRISAFTGQNSFYDFILNHSTSVISERLKNLELSAIDKEYMTYFYSSSHAMLLIKWIGDGMILPPKQIASYYEKWTIPVFVAYQDLER